MSTEPITAQIYILEIETDEYLIIPGVTLVITDTAANIATIPAEDLIDPLALGVSGIDVTDDNWLQLSVAQALAIANSGMTVTVQPGNHVFVADLAARFKTLTTADIALLPSIGIVEFSSFDARILFDLDQEDALASASIFIYDFPNVTLSVAQYRSDAAAPGGFVGQPGDTYGISDIASRIETLSSAEIMALPAAVLQITATDASVDLMVSQVTALEAASISLTVPDGDTVTLADSESDLETLSANQLRGLWAVGVTAITVTGGTLDLDVTRAQAVANGHLKVSPALGAQAVIADKAASLQSLSTTAISQLATAGFNGITATDNTRPLFSLAQVDALANGTVTIIPATANVTLTIAQYLADVAGGFVPLAGDTYAISGTAEDIQTQLTPADIMAIPSWVSVIQATDTSVVLSAAQAMALEDASIKVTASKGSVMVVDSAATLQALTTSQLLGLWATGVVSIAADDTLPVFNADQMNALGTSDVAVDAPPGDPAQNDGTAIVSGPVLNGMTFYITWDASVASAPAAFKSDVEEAFQFYANTFNGPSLYYDVGYGEVNGGSLGQGPLGESVSNPDPSVTYSGLLTAMTENQLSGAQAAAVAGLPLIDPTGGDSLSLSDAEAQALGLLVGSATSALVPDGHVGFADTAQWNFSPNPDQTPTGLEYDLYGTVEHEISEVMGRTSGLNSAGPAGMTTSYSPMDLFRFEQQGTRSLSSLATPSYFSIDDGTTNLGPSAPGEPPVGWNNYTTGDHNDLGDWGNLPSSTIYTPDAYNDGSSNGYINPISASDITLMNVLGYDLAIPTETVALPPIIDYLFFDGIDASGNNALWVSNGVASGTRELIGVNGIAGNLVAARYITTVGTNVVFNGTDLHGDNGLWVSNGTVRGTTELTGIADAANAGQGGLNPTNLTVVGNAVWFDGTALSGTVGLWETDGTAGGTHEVAAGVSATNITRYAGGIAFIGPDGGIWQSNGTAVGTGEITPASGASLGSFTVPEPLISPTASATVTISVPTTGLGPYDLYTLPNGNLIFGGNYEYTLPGATTPSVGEGLINLSASQLIGLNAPGPGGFASAGNVTYFEGMTLGISLIVGQEIDGAYGAVWQTDGTVAGTEATSDEGYDPTDLTSFAGGVLFNSQPDLGIGSIPGDFPAVGNFVGAMGSDLTVAPFPSDDADITNSGGTIIGFPGDSLDLSSPGTYYPFPLGVVAADPAENSDLFPGALTNQHAQGLDPSGIVVFDGTAYFNGINAAGQHELWELAPDAEGLIDGGVINTHFVGGGNASAPLLDATGSQLIGIGNASSAGLDPSNITALVINRPPSDPITVGQLAVDVEMNQIDPGGGNPKPGLAYDVTDTAFDLESLTPSEITLGEKIGLEGLASTSGSVVLDAVQAQALAGQAAVTVPLGDTVSVADLAANIETMTPQQFSELTAIGVTALTAIDTSVAFSVAQAVGLENPVLVTTSTIPIVVTSVGTVSISDTISAIEGMSAAQIMALPSIGVSTVAVKGQDLDLGVEQLALQAAQAVAFESSGVALSVPLGDSIVISGTPAAIEALTPAEIDGLPAVGVSAIEASGSVVLQPLQASALSSSGIPLSVPHGDTITTNFTQQLTAAAIEALTSTQVAAIVANGYTTIAATDTSVQFSVAIALSIADAPLHLTVPANDSVTVEDTSSAIALLTAPQITALGTIGVSKLIPTSFYEFQFSVAEAVALEAASIELTPEPGKPLEWEVYDSAAQIETLTPAQILALPAIRPGSDGAQIACGDDAITLSVAQFAALENGLVGLTVLPFGSVTITGTAAQFSALPASAFATLPFESSPRTIVLTVTTSPLALSVAQLQALQSNDLLNALRLPAGGTVAIHDTAADIETLLASGGYPSLTATIPLTSIVATDAAVALTVREAEALEAGTTGSDQPIPLLTLSGTVILQDIAANIESMSARQLGDLAAYGITAITVTDESLTLTVAQALALFDPVPITVPEGASIIIADTETAIDALTQSQIVGLASIGVTAIDVSDLTGAGPLTIDGGITLTIAGTVPSNQTITFSGAGGVLALGDTAGTEATIDGFSPADGIDLTDIPYDSSGNASPQSGNVLQIEENGGTYDLQLDPTQVFLTATNFVLNPDNGDGSLLNVNEAPVTGFFSLSFGQTVDGVVVSSGGEVVINDGATSNRGTVSSGGQLIGEGGATINDTVIESGGLLDLNNGYTGTGTIGFGPVASAFAGGTLEIDDMSSPAATIAGFTEGDTIDLTAISHVSTDQVTLLSADTLQLVSSIGTYDLGLSISADYTYDYFYSQNDGGDGTDIDVINETLPRTLVWTGTQGSDFASAGDWNDTTTNLDPAVLAPDPFDTAAFLSGGGTITGTGTAATLEFGGSEAWEVTSGASLTATTGVTVGLGGAGMLLIDGASLMVGPDAALSRVTGAGSRGTLPGEFDTGQSGVGGSTGNDAASDATEGFDVGLLSGGAGQATVTGSLSSLSNVGRFVVGDSGLGSLSVIAGATVTTTPGAVAGLAGMIIADTSSASGSSVDVTGAGSDLAVMGSLVVGDAGYGSLSLSQGASATVGALDLGAASTGDGEVSLAGTGTTLDVTGALILGDQSAGELSILGGAEMTVGGGVVGSGDNAPGNLDIEGIGSQLTINTGTLIVGANGPAEFTLGIGATLQGEVANGPFGVVNEYGNVDPPTDPNDGTQNVGFGNSLIYDFYVANSGTIKITSGTATFYTPLATDETNAADGSTNGLWVIGAHDTLVMNTTSVDQTQTFDFTSPSAASLVIGQIPQASTTGSDTFNGQTMPSLTGSITPGSPNVLPGWNAPIENYQSGDVIVLRGLVYGSATASGDVVTMWSGAGGTGSPLGSLTFVTKSDAPSSTEAAAAASQINALACFAQGTLIETSNGLVAVEELRVGDTVMTRHERCEPIVWVGSRAVDCARHPQPLTVWPVRIVCGAFGENVPARDLYLSPDHAVYIDGVLVPAKLLINGTSITQVKRDRVTYYHVELPEHTVILAEGLAVESYLDTGNRLDFGGGRTIRLFPDLGVRLTPDAAAVWETRGAAPLAMTAEKLDTARAFIAANASRRDLRLEKATSRNG